MARRMTRAFMTGFPSSEIATTPAAFIEAIAASSSPALPFVIAFVALIVMAWMLAGIMGHLGQVSIRGGVISGFLVWLGFVITTMGVNHAFSGAPTKLTLIDGGYWLAVLLIQGAVIGAFGV